MVDDPFLLPEGAVAATGGGFAPRSDRGWRHRAPDWVAACEAAGAARSMSRRGRSPGNAAAEGLFGRLKAFGEGGGTVYDTIRGRREQLGLAA